MNGSVEIEVMGQKYSLKSDYDMEYVKRIEKYINNKIEEVKKTGSTITTHHQLILTILFLADESLKKEDQLHALQASVSDRSSRLIEMITNNL